MLSELNSFEQLKNEDAHHMYYRLNSVINEINCLGVKSMTNGEVNRKIIHSLRKPDYDIIKSLLLKEDLNNMKPNELINHLSVYEHSTRIYTSKKSLPPQAKRLTLSSSRVAPSSNHANLNYDERTQALVKKKRRVIVSQGKMRMMSRAQARNQSQVMMRK